MRPMHKKRIERNQKLEGASRYVGSEICKCSVCGKESHFSEGMCQACWHRTNAYKRVIREERKKFKRYLSQDTVTIVEPK